MFFDQLLLLAKTFVDDRTTTSNCSSLDGHENELCQQKILLQQLLLLTSVLHSQSVLHQKKKLKRESTKKNYLKYKEAQKKQLKMRLKHLFCPKNHNTK